MPDLVDVQNLRHGIFLSKGPMCSRQSEIGQTSKANPAPHHALQLWPTVAVLVAVPPAGAVWPFTDASVPGPAVAELPWSETPGLVSTEIDAAVAPEDEEAVLPLVPLVLAVAVPSVEVDVATAAPLAPADSLDTDPPDAEAFAVPPCPSEAVVDVPASPALLVASATEPVSVAVLAVVPPPLVELLEVLFPFADVADELPLDPSDVDEADVAVPAALDVPSDEFEADTDPFPPTPAAVPPGPDAAEALPSLSTDAVAPGPSAAAVPLGPSATAPTAATPSAFPAPPVPCPPHSPPPASPASPGPSAPAPPSPEEKRALAQRFQYSVMVVAPWLVA